MDETEKALTFALDVIRTTATALAEKGYSAWAVETLNLARKVEKIAGRYP